MEGRFPIRAAAKLTALSLDTLRAWERRYAAIVPERTHRGRLYSKADIAKLILLRRLVEQGHSIGSIAGLGMSNLQALLPAEPIEEPPPPPPSTHVSRLADWFTAFDDVRANQELGRMALISPPRELVMQILLPLARETGDRWERGQMGVAQEHLVSGSMRNMLGSLLRLHPPPPGAPRMLLAALSGELHDLGILSAAMIATTTGWCPLFLGANLPSTEIAAAAQRTRPKLVVIGNSGRRATAQSIADLAALLPPEVALWVGGPTPLRSKSALPESVLVIPAMDEFERACIEALR